MFCSVIGCFQSDDKHVIKLLPKDQSEINVWLKFVKLRRLTVSKDNIICESHYKQYNVLVHNILRDERRNKIVSDTKIKNSPFKLDKKRINVEECNVDIDSDTKGIQVKKKKSDDDNNNDDGKIYVCRLCGKTQSYFMKSLFTPEITSIPGFHDFIICYFEIRILETDALKTICSNCIKRIRSIIAFKAKCQEVNNVNGIKFETDTNDNNEEDNTDVKIIDDKPAFEFVASNGFDSDEQTVIDPKLLVKIEIKTEETLDEPGKIIEVNSDEKEDEDEDEIDKGEFNKTESYKKIEIEDDDTNFKHKCTHCQKFLRTRRALRVHAQVCRLGGKWKGDEKFRETCPICHKKVMMLKHHMPFHSKKKRFICKFCDNKFYVEASLREHLEIHNEKKLKCPDCDEMFHGPIHLRRHKRKHNDSAKKHMCEFCSRRFIKPVELRMHIGVFHNGEKAFKCDECNEGFNYRNMLHRHVEKVHNTNINIGRTNRISKLYLDYPDK